MSCVLEHDGRKFRNITVSGGEQMLGYKSELLPVSARYAGEPPKELAIVKQKKTEAAQRPEKYGFFSLQSAVFLLLTAVFMNCRIFAPAAYASDRTVRIEPAVYEFGEDSGYEISSAAAVSAAPVPGDFSICGDIAESEGKDEISSFTVGSGTVSFLYSPDPSIFGASDEEWRSTDDKTKQVDGISLESDVKSGALILQSSLDGETWTTDVIRTDIFGEDADFSEPFYTSKYIQQENGCYFRLLTVCEMVRKTGSRKLAVVSVDKKEYKKIAGVYEFYLYSPSAGENAGSASDTPRRELGSKIRTENNSGYSGQKEIDKNDPHYGWDIGSFTVNGYTRETEKDGVPVFLKNVGDKVTLWFRLEQDIDCLNGNGALTIAENTKAYDRAFEVPQTNFERGTLIIRYTNEQGVSEDPVIYTNYLAAGARTGADTRVVLFEEGDYEVSLDYEIKNDPRRIGPVSVVPTYTDYKIAFRFSIRNGNCMVYPFDSQTGAELADRAITANGFMLDMARSRYRTIDVTRSVLKEGADGLLTADVRFNRPAKDGETYTDPGIYTFTVKNLYTGESTEKTVYVGTEKYLNALSKSGVSVSELNDQLGQGAAVQEDGSLVFPVSAGQEPAAGQKSGPEQKQSPSGAPEGTEPAVETTASGEASGAKTPLALFGALAAAVLCVGGFLIMKKRDSGKEIPDTKNVEEENDQ